MTDVRKVVTLGGRWYEEVVLEILCIFMCMVVTHTQFLSCALYIRYASIFLTNIFKWSLHHSTILIIICHSLLEGHEIPRACDLFCILREMGTYLSTVQMRILRCGIFRQRHHYRLCSLRLDWQVSWWVQSVNRDLWHLCPLSWHYLCASQRLGLDALLKLPKGLIIS